MSTATPRQILDTPMQENDAEAATIGAYLAALLLGVWNEGEGFDGKRPFGNSSWEGEVHEALVRAGHVTGTIDSDGYLDPLTDEAEQTAQALVEAAIRTLALPTALPPCSNCEGEYFACTACGARVDPEADSR